MAEKTAIAWCDATWSPWEGCQKAGPGCDHCYAEAMNNWLRKGENWGPGAPRRVYSDQHWEKPIRWNAKAEKAGKRLSVFPSVCDPFDNASPEGQRARFGALMRATPWLDWLLLTKRVGNVQAMAKEMGGWPANARLGITVVNQAEADRDIMRALHTKKALGIRVLFLSCEPLLEDLRLWKLRALDYEESREGAEVYPLRGLYAVPDCDWDGPKIDQVIVGGESGRGARDFDIGWARSIVNQCAVNGTPVFVKQMGAKPVWSDDDDSEPPHWGRIKLIDKSGAEPAEWPIDLRVQEFPPCIVVGKPTE